MLIRNYLRAEMGTTETSIKEAIAKLEEFYFEDRTSSNASLEQNLNVRIYINVYFFILYEYPN